MLFGRFKHCLVFIQSFQDGFSIKFRRSQPPANSVGFFFDIPKAIDLFGNSWIEGLETTQEFLLHPKQKYTLRVLLVGQITSLDNTKRKGYRQHKLTHSLSSSTVRPPGYPRSSHLTRGVSKAFWISTEGRLVISRNRADGI